MQRSDAGVKKETELRFVRANVVNIVPSDWVDFSAESDSETQRQHDKNNIVGQFISAAVGPNSHHLAYPILNATGEPETIAVESENSTAEGSENGDDDKTSNTVSSSTKKGTATTRTKKHDSTATATTISNESGAKQEIPKKKVKEPKLKAPDIRVEELSEDEQGSAYEYDYWSNECCGGNADVEKMLREEREEEERKQKEFLKAPSAATASVAGTVTTTATKAAKKVPPPQISSMSSLLKPTASSAVTNDKIIKKKKIFLTRKSSTTKMTKEQEENENDDDDSEMPETPLMKDGNESPKSPQIRVQREFVNKNGGITTKVWSDDL